MGCHQSAQKLPTDDELLDLRGAFVQAQQAHIAVEAFHRPFVNVSCAAVNLHDEAHHVGGKELGAGYAHRDVRIGHVGRLAIAALSDVYELSCR